MTSDVGLKIKVLVFFLYSILRIHRRHTKVHKYPQYNSVRHLSDQTIIQRHGYNGISL